MKFLLVLLPILVIVGVISADPVGSISGNLTVEEIKEKMEDPKFLPSLLDLINLVMSLAQAAAPSQ